MLVHDGTKGLNMYLRFTTLPFPFLHCPAGFGTCSVREHSMRPFPALLLAYPMPSRWTAFPPLS